MSLHFSMYKDHTIFFSPLKPRNPWVRGLVFWKFFFHAEQNAFHFWGDFFFCSFLEVVFLYFFKIHIVIINLVLWWFIYVFNLLFFWLILIFFFFRIFGPSLAKFAHCLFSHVVERNWLVVKAMPDLLNGPNCSCNDWSMVLTFGNAHLKHQGLSSFGFTFHDLRC